MDETLKEKLRAYLEHGTPLSLTPLEQTQFDFYCQLLETFTILDNEGRFNA
jgi:hypothetical protein